MMYEFCLRWFRKDFYFVNFFFFRIGTSASTSLGAFVFNSLEVVFLTSLKAFVSISFGAFKSVSFGDFILTPFMTFVMTSVPVFVLTPSGAFTFFTTDFSFLHSLQTWIVALAHSCFVKKLLTLLWLHLLQSFVCAWSSPLQDQQLRIFPSSFFHSSFEKSLLFLIFAHSPHFFSTICSLILRRYWKKEARGKFNDWGIIQDRLVT